MKEFDAIVIGAGQAGPFLAARMAAMGLDGLTGKVAFDEYGDSTTRVLTVYKVEGGAWVADETSEFGRN